MRVHQIKDPRLAQYAYIVGGEASAEALIIDPERDVDRYLRFAERQGLKIVAVAETHIHADFLSGARELAERFGARLYLSGEGGPDWQPQWAMNAGYDLDLLFDGSTFVVGDLEVTARHTPGHTPEHMTFLLRDLGAEEETPIRAVTGDFVFVSDLGRPDLLESAAGIAGMMESSARALYRSVQESMAWPDDLLIWPGHGAGSACGKALGEAPATTWGTEKLSSPAVQAAALGEQVFVDFILEGQPEPPLYFARMKKLNRDGVPLLGDVSRPDRLPAEQLVGLAGRTDVAVIDTRHDRADFMASHVPASFYAPLDEIFHTVVGSYFDARTPVFLIASEEEVDELVRDLARIGIDDVRGWFSPDVFEEYERLGGELTATESVDFGTIVAMGREPGDCVLDVRSAVEFATDGHVVGAINVAHTRLWDRLEEIPRDSTVYVYCHTGRRAVRAAALLERQDYEAVVVDDDFEGWRTDASSTAAAVA